MAKTDQLRSLYPAGTRIRLIHMDDPYQPVPSGTEGTIKFVDDAGQIHVRWDNGSGLAVIPDVDEYEIVHW